MINNKPISDNQDIANGFNSYFSTVGPALSSKISVDSDKNVDTYLIQRIAHSFSLTQCQLKKYKKLSIN